MNNFKVPIKNVLFIYSYVWDKVNKKDLIDLESLDNFPSPNIYAELFLINIEKILNQGLYKEYLEKNEELKGIKGKIDFKNSINNMSFKNAKAYCIYDELEINNIYNQILKTTTLKLYNLEGLEPDTKKKLNIILLYFNQINTIEIDKKTFTNLIFSKNNMYYYLIIKICELINDNLMLSEKKGKYKFINLFEDETNFEKIFELFVYKFYKKHLKSKYNVFYHKKINWKITEGNQINLPIMELDTTIFSKEKNETIIIDTKYYEKFYNIRYDKKKYISENLYQITAYLNNYNCPGDLKGILIYPMPKSNETINEKYKLNIVKENKIYQTTIKIITIDLSKDSDEITSDLLRIIEEI